MRKPVLLALLAPLLALAACGEHAGWNPNYSAMHNGSDYAGYVQAREQALQGKGSVQPAIPVVLPAHAPVVAARTKAPGTVTVTAGTAAAGVVPANAQVATTGPYPGSTPVLVRYAHQEQQAVGARKYQRGAGAADAARACAAYATADAAQIAFIAAGGPVIDPRGLDPDGDGFVCGWDPAPFRKPRV